MSGPTQKTSIRLVVMALVIGSSIAAVSPATAQTPEDANDFLSEFRELQGSPAFEEYNEFEVVRSQAVVAVQAGEFDDTERRQMRLVLQALRSFNTAYRLSQNGSVVESVRRANETGQALNQLSAGGGEKYSALAGLALEILESKGATASMVDFEVVPGVPAAQSCGARLGAPLVNDTVSISLSDHLTSMPTIESRLHAAAGEGFTIAIYNPWSRKRRENFRKCCEILLEHRAPDTPVGIVHGAGRDDEQVDIVELRELEALGETDLVDMTTTILVGNEETYVWDDRMVTPRGYESKYDY